MDDFLEKKPKKHSDAALATAARFSWEFVLYSKNEPPSTSRQNLGSSTSDNWLLESGNWLLESGNWLLESGNWLLESGNWLLESGNQFPEVELPRFCPILSLEMFPRV